MKKRLISHELKSDPRIKEAKRLIHEAVEEHQKKLTGVEAPSEAFAAVEKEYELFSKLRGWKLYYPYIGSGIGNGSLVELVDGSVKYDFITGIGVHCFGHSNIDLLPTLVDTALSDTVMQGNLQQNEEPLELTELLIEKSGMDACLLSSSGAMANENALKVLFQYHFPRSRILAFEDNFCGRTFALSDISDRPQYRKGLPKTIDVDYIPFFDPEHPEESLQKTLSTLDTLNKRYPNSHVALCCELIQGEGGFNVGEEHFFKEVMRAVKEKGISVLADEVQTFGRTTELFCFQHYHLEEFIDIVTIGKLSQVCATLYKKELTPEAGLLSQTFTSSTSAIASGKFVVEQLLERGFFGKEGRNQKIFERFGGHIQRLQKKFPGAIEGPFGCGAMVAFQLFGGDGARTVQFLHQLYEKGVIGFPAGQNPCRVRFLVPMLVIKDEEIDQAMQIVENCLDEAL